MVQMVAGHGFMTQVQMGVPLNSDGRFLVLFPSKFQPSFDKRSLCYSSLKRFSTFLRPIKETHNSVFYPFVRKSLIKLPKAPTKRIKGETSNNLARDVSIGRRKWLQETRASTTQAIEETELEYLASDYGWRVRCLATDKEEMDDVAQIQTEAFHDPAPIWNSFFFMISKAEVLGALLYKIRNSPPNRYACLVAEASSDTVEDGIPDRSKHKLIGVVDVTAYVDKYVLCHLEGAEEYLYVSGLAVRENYRRRKVGTVLLKACDVMAIQRGFQYLVLRAYKDDAAATTLYSKAGYKVVFEDPPWTSTWIGKKQRVLMVKRTSYDKLGG